MKRILLKIKCNKGYTLVELLAVIVVMVVVGMIIATIIVSSLRGGNKTSAINEIRDSGNTAMTRMSRAIEFAKNFEGVSETANGTFRTDCLPPDIAPLTPTPPIHYKSVKIRDFDEGESTFSCLGTSIASLSAAGTVDLIDQSRIASKETECYFTCTQAYLSQPPTIGINFTLSKAVDTVFFEQKYSSEFHTSVLMHNLGP